MTVSVIEDSRHPRLATARLTTLSLAMPRIILAELNTHRMFSRSASSSRAVPVDRMADLVDANPFIPRVFYSSQRGMQGGEPLSEAVQQEARRIWTDTLHVCIEASRKLKTLGVHKQHANRPMEFGAYVNVLVTATDWSNFFHLRRSTNAQPEMQQLADMMHEAMQHSAPVTRDMHLPYITADERASMPVLDMFKASTARCARVSYLKHDNTAPSLDDDLRLHDMLTRDGHWSPCEHQAAAVGERYYANFYGWEQYRKVYAHEYIKDR